MTTRNLECYIHLVDKAAGFERIDSGFEGSSTVDQTASRAIEKRFSIFHLMAHRNELLKFCGTPSNIFFADLSKRNRYNLIHSHQRAIVTLAVVIFLFDYLREKRSMPLTK